MKHYFMLIVVASIVFSSCSNDDDDDDGNTEIPKPNFYALNKGNSWVYKYYELDKLTGKYDKETGVVDSVFVTGKEKIKGEEYYKLKTITTGKPSKSYVCSNSNGEEITFVRDSLGFLIELNTEKSKSKIIFTNSTNDELFIESRSFGDIYAQLEKDSVKIEVGGGEFNCLKMNVYSKLKNGETSLGKNEFYYSDGFGLIRSTCSFAGTKEHISEKRLESYIIN